MKSAVGPGPDEVEAHLSCEHEMLHLSGAIQSFGAMVCFDAASGAITHCSENFFTFTGRPAGSINDLMGASIFSLGWIQPVQVQQIAPETHSTLAIAKTVFSDSISGLLIRSTSGIVLELEQHALSSGAIPIHQIVSQFLEVPDSEDDVRASQKFLLRAIEQVASFDRLMLYKFHDDWSGEVVAEVTTSGTQAYLGLHFPASDIPAIARNLYMINPSRSIPDAQASEIGIFSRDGFPPDLTRSELRSVSPQHLQYLANMGVRSSFSVPMMVGNTLWGLVACHHMSVRHLSADQRRACIALVRAHALGVMSFLASRRVQLVDSLSRDIDKVLKQLFSAPDPLNELEKYDNQIMAWFSADGLAIAIDDDVVVAGECPDFEAMGVIDDWLVLDQEKPTACSDHISDILNKSADRSVHSSAVAGVFAVKIFSVQRGWVRLYWFRQEEIREVSWAGQPHKTAAGTTGSLSPRTSFEKWVEKKSGYSRPWTSEDLLVGAKFRSALARCI